MNADPADQLRLLDLQALDTALDQLDRRRRMLPEHARAAQLSTQRSAVESALIVAQTELSDLRITQAKADQDVELVRGRIDRDKQRMDSGAVATAKDLEALQRELVSLARRQSDLEDTELEVMERVENAASRVHALEADRGRIVSELAAVVAARDVAAASIDADTSETRAERTTMASCIPTELLALYDKLRETNDGVGAAALEAGRCLGCQMELTPVELARLRAAPPELVTRCEECTHRRILVRR